MVVPAKQCAAESNIHGVINVAVQRRAELPGSASALLSITTAGELPVTSTPRANFVEATSRIAGWQALLSTKKTPVTFTIVRIPRLQVAIIIKRMSHEAARNTSVSTLSPKNDMRSANLGKRS